MVHQSLLLCSATVGASAYLAHFIDMLLLMAQFDALFMYLQWLSVPMQWVVQMACIFLGTLCCLIYMCVHISNYYIDEYCINKTFILELRIMKARQQLLAMHKLQNTMPVASNCPQKM